MTEELVPESLFKASLVVTPPSEKAHIVIEHEQFKSAFPIEDIKTAHLLLALAELVGDSFSVSSELYSFLEGSEGMALHIMTILAKNYSFTPQMLAELAIETEKNYRESLPPTNNQSQVVNAIEGRSARLTDHESRSE